MATSTHRGTNSHVDVAGGGAGRGKGCRHRHCGGGVAQRTRAGQSPRHAAHLSAAGGAVDMAHGRAGGIDRRTTGRL